MIRANHELQNSMALRTKLILIAKLEKKIRNKISDKGASE
jgi:hypothetical protein